MHLLNFFSIVAIGWRVLADNVRELMYAIKMNKIDEVKELLKRVDVNSVDPEGWNVLHTAVYYPDVKIIRLLISNGAGKVINDRLVIRRESYTPLMIACSVSSKYEYEVMEVLLKAGADPNIVCPKSKNAALHLVSTEEQARLLISYGADVNVVNSTGCSPVHTSVGDKFYYNILYALMDGEADFTIANSWKETIFHLFMDRDMNYVDGNFIKLLAAKGAPLESFNRSGETPLTKFMKRDDTLHFLDESEEAQYEYMKNSFYTYMTEAGANLSTQNERGESLLHISALKYYKGAVKWLLDNGVETEAKNVTGDTPLLALVKLKVWNHLNYRGRTSFLPTNEETAAARDVIDALINGGANIEAVDNEGRNTLHYIKEGRIIGYKWYIHMVLKKKNAIARKNVFNTWISSLIFH